MTLIKEIKHSETQAQEIIAKARSDAETLAQQNKQKRIEVMEQSQQERKKAIEAAVAGAQQQGLAEVEGLKAKAEKDRSNLHDKLAGKITDAAARVMEYLKG